MPKMISFAQPSSRARRLVLAGLPFMLAVGLVGSPFAQSGPGPEKPRGRHPAMRLLGPISPEVLRDSIGVTGAKLDQYTRQYRSHMAATKPARDSLQSALRSIRAARESGDRTAARNTHQALRQQAESLMKRDRDFEAGLKNILSQDQQQRYAQWKENRMRLARERHEGRRHHGTTFSDSARS